MESRDLTRIAMIAATAYVIRKAIQSTTRLAWGGFGFAWVAYWTGGFGWVRHVLF